MNTAPNSRADLLARLNADVAPGTFAAALGLRFVEATLDNVVAHVEVPLDYISRPSVVHGGVLMAIADTVGGFATRINLQPAQRTTTIESKTNFLRSAAPGRLLSAKAKALHKGRTIMVWQTVISDQKNRNIAVTTQTQLVIDASLAKVSNPVEQTCQTLPRSTPI
ncbi:MAG: PaaI family thioesterase [Methylobacteriaceae bacterium]|nr:PaaI family thioesterase [Methylobacteriaceae bacterium]